MYKFILISILILFLLENLIKQKTLLKLKTTRGIFKEISNHNVLAALDFFRLLQLLFIGILFSSAEGNLTTIQGLITVILVGLQFLRFLGKRIIQYRNVLDVIQILETITLVTLLFLPFNYQFQHTSHSSAYRLTLLSGLIYIFFTALSFPFTISFFIKFFSKEGSNNFLSSPPLYEYEKWSIKLSIYSIIFGFLTLFLLFFRGKTFLALELILPLFMQYLGIHLSRKPIFNGYHLTSNILWSLSSMLLYSIAIYNSISIANTF